MAINSTPVTLNSIFSGESTYSMDLVQREYTWGKSDIEHYLMSLNLTLGSTEKNKSHFFSHFLVTDNGDDTIVFDGQQRLVTTYILFIVLRDLLVLQDANHIVTFNNILFTGSFESKPTKRITLRSSHQDESLAKLLTGKLDGVDTLTQNYFTIKQFVVKNNLISSIFKLLSSSSKVVLDNCTNTEEARRQFEIINAGGKNLSDTDNFRAKLINDAITSEKVLVADTWSSVYNHLHKHKNKSDFLKYVDHVEFGGKKGAGTGKTVFYLETIMKAYTLSPLEVSKKYQLYSEKIAQIVMGNNPYTKTPDTYLKLSISTFNSYLKQYCMSPTLYMLLTFTKDDFSVKSRKLFYYFAWLRLNTEARYSSEVRSIMKDNNFKYTPDSVKLIHVMQLKTNAKKLPYLLLLEDYLRFQAKSSDNIFLSYLKDTKTYNVEHIHPVSTHAALKEHIGNTLFWSEGANKSIKDTPLSEKLVEYQKSATSMANQYTHEMTTEEWGQKIVDWLNIIFNKELK